jgi:3-oxoacyl-[acyl-carrier protein] reductase
MGKLTDQVVLVTGAGRNLGRAMAKRVAQEGAAVGVNTLSNAEAAAYVVSEIAAFGGHATALVGDVSREDQATELVAGCAEVLGPITSVIHCAAYRSHFGLLELPLAEWRLSRQVALGSAHLLARAVLPAMLEVGFGRFVLIGGTAMNTGLPIGHAHVATAKAALRGFVRALAQETGRSGVTANVVSPGTIDTETRKGERPNFSGWDAVEQSILGRMVTMHEITTLCAYLCSPEAQPITGQVINADGGTFAFGQ